MKLKKRILTLLLTLSMVTTCFSLNVIAAEQPPEFPEGVTSGEVDDMGPPPDQGGGNTSSTTKISTIEGDWSFDITTTTSGTNKTITSSITYYSGKTDQVVIVPSVLGGAPVTKISAQAFGHHSEIMAVYVPNSVTEIDDWAFYDLNTAIILSFANPSVSIKEGAFQSSGNAALYLPTGTTQTSAGGKAVVTGNTESISVSINNSSAAAIGGGAYLNVTNSSSYGITASSIANICKSASGKTSDVSFTNNTVTFTGDNYVPAAQVIEIYKNFTNDVSENELNKTFRSLTAEEASALNNKIANDSSYNKVKTLLNFQEGYYINGNKVDLDKNAVAYDVKTGENISIDEKSGKFPSTNSHYKYVTYRDTDSDGDVDILYYSPYSVTYSYNPVTIYSNNTNLNGLSARDILSNIYLSFANSVVKTSGEGDNLYKKSLTATTSSDGDIIGAKANENRSILWANDYGTIDVDELHAASSSVGNWAKMSYETGLSSYNVEIMMEWGMNALLYATNGGKITVGELNGKKSTFSANGDGTNGIIAGGAGTKAGNKSAPSDTSSAYVYNADFNLKGWNNHVADVVYGGYAYLNKISSVTGTPGSYSVGQSSALANDFGNGVVDVKDFRTTVYGNRSAGAYVIGGGVITAEDSSFLSKMDAGFVSASGGSFKVNNSSAIGQIAFRNRGGINTDSTSTFNKVNLTADKDIKGYVLGETAAQAVAAWKEASGSSDLIHYMMSDSTMTIGTLCNNYGISKDASATLIKKLSKIAGKKYTTDTMLRNSVLDNTYYNYSAGKYTGTTDFSDVPYLTSGSAYGGLVSSVMEFEASGINLVFNESKFSNTNKKDYNYLVASEAGSAPIINFNKSNSEGIIWNEGDVNRNVEGRTSSRSSKLTVNFTDSNFNGSFADGSNGLWKVNNLSYTDGTGKISNLNGNYYGAKANFGISASFNKNSTWTITNDSYLGSLIISEDANIKAPEGYKIEMTVNGVKTEIVAGTYTGQVILKLVKA
ncbi:hypothetical protein CLPUN_33550 [Clostridium puniceum]|uniref:Uncharacterized protein n=1 Tax=Clostridium puniceum TaxID=29367 RepID=A0A1S8TC36_9CLOT|nr:leucine-rich repeat protein [Clostridium puniceum]OOM75298.1 hypothetical protein CLPUN_33550 [Clostridium puniceum]